MNEERTGKCLRQVEHIRGHLWTQIFHSSQLSHGGDRKTFEVMSWLINGFVTRLTRRVSLVEQELLTLQEWGSCYSIFSFICMYVLYIGVCTVVLFLLAIVFSDLLLLLAIVFSDLLRYMDSDYSFGIFLCLMNKSLDLTVLTITRQLCKPYHYSTICLSWWYCLHNWLEIMQTVVPTQCAYYLYLSHAQKLNHRIIIILRNQTTFNNYFFSLHINWIDIFCQRVHLIFDKRSKQTSGRKHVRPNQWTVMTYDTPIRKSSTYVFPPIL
jgi:hypothetical protein